MKEHGIASLFLLFILSSCDDCRDNDCGGDDLVRIRMVDDPNVNYVDSLDFYYYDEQQRKVSAVIQRGSRSLADYDVLLDYRRQLGTQHRYYLAFRDETQEIDLTVRYEDDPCCGDYLRIEEVSVDGQPTTLPIEVANR